MKMSSPIKLCECGCGEKAKPGNRFVFGHHSRGDNNPSKRAEIKAKISKAKMGKSRPDMVGKNNPMYGKRLKGKDNPFYGRKHTEKSKQKMRETTTGMYSGENNPMYGKKRPDVRLKMLVDNPVRRLEVRVKISKAKKGKPWNGKHSVDGLKRMSEAKKGINNPMYKDGNGKEPYGPDFTEKLKKHIMFRDNYKCQSPFCNGRSKKLDVHHIDSNKKNNNKRNLITVCRSCNVRAALKDDVIKFRKALEEIMSYREECFC